MPIREGVLQYTHLLHILQMIILENLTYYLLI